MTSSTLKVVGEVDMATGDELVAAIHDILSGDQVSELIVDLERVGFLDATGITALIIGYRLAAERGARFRVVNPNVLVHRILAVTGVLPLFSGIE